MLDRKILDEALQHCRVAPGKPLDLGKHAPDWLPLTPRDKGEKAELKDSAEELLDESRKRLADTQELLWADDSHALLVILQGLDAAGKDGIVKHVMSEVNPLGCEVTAFKSPSPEELDHDFLWRCVHHLPEKGRIGIFNRSYYEEVLVVRVHPGFLKAQRLPREPSGEALWTERFASIRNFERHLTVNGTVVRKFFLNISPGEQRKRLIERIEDTKKFWKFNLGDAQERAHWDDYQTVFAQALSATSTEEAPWYVIPADHKWFARTLVAHVLADAIEALKLRWPEPTAADRKEMAEAKRLLAKD